MPPFDWEFNVFIQPSGDDPFDWEFTTGGRPDYERGRKCHRGPMTPLEILISKPFTIYTQIELLRNRVLESVVDTHLMPVRTRELVLRTLNSNLGPIFIDQWNNYEELNVLICEKKNSIVVDRELAPLDRLYLNSLPLFINNGVPENYISLIKDALQSSNAILRVAGRCSIITLAGTLELSKVG
jgi:hypothetical protein